MSTTHQYIFRQQQGVILIVALVMLLVMTVAGVTTMTGATLQERIAGNSRQKIVARINANTAMRAAETVLDNLHSGNSINTLALNNAFAGNNALYRTKPIINGQTTEPLSAANLDVIDETTWDDTNSLAVPVGAPTGRYIIEYMGQYDESGYTTGGTSIDGTGGDEEGKTAARKVFRITALGLGNNTNVASVLQSYYLEEAP